MDPATDTKLHNAVQALRDARPRDAITLLLPVAEDAAEVQDRRVELIAHTLLGPAHVGAGDLERARTHGERALELARQLEDEEAAAQAHRFLRELSPDGSLFNEAVGAEGDVIDQAFDRAGQALTRGDAAEAVALLVPVLEEAARFGDLQVEASASGMMAQAMMMLGRLDEARAQAQRALDIAIFSRDPHAERHFQELIDQLGSQQEADRAMLAARVASRARVTLGVAGQALEGGDGEGALQVLWPVLHDANAAGAFGAEASLRGLIAQALLSLGRRGEAIEQANHAAALADELGDGDAAASFRQIAELALGFLPPAGEA